MAPVRSGDGRSAPRCRARCRHLHALAPRAQGTEVELLQLTAALVSHGADLRARARGRRCAGSLGRAPGSVQSARDRCWRGGALPGCPESSRLVRNARAAHRSRTGRTRSFDSRATTRVGRRRCRRARPRRAWCRGPCPLCTDRPEQQSLRPVSAVSTARLDPRNEPQRGCASQVSPRVMLRRARDHRPMSKLLRNIRTGGIADQAALGFLVGRAAVEKVTMSRSPRRGRGAAPARADAHTLVGIGTGRLRASYDASVAARHVYVPAFQQGKSFNDGVAERRCQAAVELASTPTGVTLRRRNAR